jgi:hypothetical protein
MLVMDTIDQIKADRELIEHLGGPTKTCELLGYDKTKGGVQRVQNWMTRGIPAQVKLDHPSLFMREILGPDRPGRKPPSVSNLK